MATPVPVILASIAAVLLWSAFVCMLMKTKEDILNVL